MRSARLFRVRGQDPVTTPRALRAIGRALQTFDTDIGTVENAISGLSKSFDEHDKADVRRFLQVHETIDLLRYEIEFVKNHVNLVHDQMIEGFRAMNVVINKRDPNEVTPPRRGRNGR